MRHAPSDGGTRIVAGTASRGTGVRSSRSLFREHPEPGELIEQGLTAGQNEARFAGDSEKIRHAIALGEMGDIDPVERNDVGNSGAQKDVLVGHRLVPVVDMDQGGLMPVETGK